jgi:cellulose 1,4-beta-cellobiosidase
MKPRVQAAQVVPFTTIPVHEPYMTATQTVDGNPVGSVQYYFYDPYIDEFTHDEAMYSNLVSAGFPSTVGMLIDTSRDGWADPSLRPTSACPFRGDWCTPENAGIGAPPQANPRFHLHPSVRLRVG